MHVTISFAVSPRFPLSLNKLRMAFSIVESIEKGFSPHFSLFFANFRRFLANFLPFMFSSFSTSFSLSAAIFSKEISSTKRSSLRRMALPIETAPMRSGDRNSGAEGLPMLSSPLGTANKLLNSASLCRTTWPLCRASDVAAKAFGSDFSAAAAYGAAKERRAAGDSFSRLADGAALSFSITFLRSSSVETCLNSFLGNRVLILVSRKSST